MAVSFYSETPQQYYTLMNTQATIEPKIIGSMYERLISRPLIYNFNKIDYS